jgi:hypothetical protein
MDSHECSANLHSSTKPAKIFLGEFFPCGRRRRSNNDPNRGRGGAELQEVCFWNQVNGDKGTRITSAISP